MSQLRYTYTCCSIDVRMSIRFEVRDFCEEVNVLKYCQLMTYFMGPDAEIDLSKL